MREITLLSPQKQAAVGGLSGMSVKQNEYHSITNILVRSSAAGYLFAKASKAAAFAIGASILGLAVSFIMIDVVIFVRIFLLQIANQSGYIDIHFDRIRDTAQRQLDHVQRAAISNLPQPTTTNVDGEEIETFVDQSPSSLADFV